MVLSDTIKNLSKTASADKTVHITPQGGGNKNVSFSISAQIELGPGAPGLEVIKLINSIKAETDFIVKDVLNIPHVLSEGYVSLFGKGSGVTLNYSFLVEDSACRYSPSGEEYLQSDLKARFNYYRWKVK